MPTHQSRRRIARDLVKLESDAATKEEHGRRIDARHRRATEALLEREQELVAGFAEMAYVGLVSVAATSEDELEEHSRTVEQLAHESGMDLRVLDGRQTGRDERGRLPAAADEDGSGGNVGDPPEVVKQNALVGQ